MTAQKNACRAAARRVSMLMLLAAAGGALAQAAPAASNASLRLSDAKVVWVDNESFAFETCSPAGGEHVSAVMGSMRTRLMNELGPIMLNNGVTPSSQQFVTLTPVSGTQACDTLASRVVFRVAGFGARPGQVWSADIVAQTQGPQGPAADARQASVQLVNDLVHALDVTLSQSH